MFKKNAINWAGQIKNNADINELFDRSEERPVGLFKHHSLNAISIMTMGNLNALWTIDERQLEMYILDAGSYRSASNSFSVQMGLRDEVAQLLVLYKNQLLYHAIQSNISVSEVQAILDKHYPLPADGEDRPNDAPE